MYKKCTFCGKENLEEMTHCWNCEEDLSEICVTRKKIIRVNPAIDHNKNIDTIKRKK